MPPLFFSPRSRNGNFHPPSAIGVASHSLIRCRGGAGGAWSLYSVLACRTCALERNCMSPTSRIICSESRQQVSSRTEAAASCSADMGGMRPASEKRERERTKYGSHLVVELVGARARVWLGCRTCSTLETLVLVPARDRRRLCGCMALRPC
jgi:hypothetical protein